MDDLISKLSVLELIDDYNSDALGSVFIDYSHGLKFKRAVLKLPSAEKTGKWEEVKNSDGASHDYRCSVCHRYRFHNGEMRSKYKYCPNCGCRMVEQRESEDKE